MSVALKSIPTLVHLCYIAAIVTALVTLAFKMEQNRELAESNRTMAKALADRSGTVQLPSKDWSDTKAMFRIEKCKCIHADLDSGDPARIRRWSDYFQHIIEIDTQFKGSPPSLEQRLEAYKLRE